MDRETSASEKHPAGCLKLADKKKPVACLVAPEQDHQTDEHKDSGSRRVRAKAEM